MPMDDSRAASKRPVWVWLIGAALVLIGAGVIVAGGLIAGLSDYDRSVLVNVGTALALVGPLFIAERLLQIRVKEVEREAVASAAFVRTAVSDLNREVRERLAGLRAQDERRREAAAEGSFEDLVDLYREVEGRGWIDRRGLRVAIGLGDLRLKVRVIQIEPDGEKTWIVELSFEGPRLTPIGDTVIWSPQEATADVFVRLAERLREANRWPGEEVFDPKEILNAVSVALGRVIDLHVGSGGDRRVRQVIELVNEDWAVTREGMDSLLDPDLYVDAGDLQHQANLAMEKLEDEVQRRGLDEAAFRSAFGDAERIHRALHDGWLQGWAKLGRA